LGAGVVVCLEQGADLHMAQLMPLPVTHCLLLQLNPDWFYLSGTGSPKYSPGKKAVKWLCVCVCVCGQLSNNWFACVQHSTSTSAGRIPSHANPILWIEKVEIRLPWHTVLVWSTELECSPMFARNDLA